jgi:CheY-like chemotaxis protein
MFGDKGTHGREDDSINVDYGYSSEGMEFNDDIVFQGIASDFCVCMLDIVNSTTITSSLFTEDKIRKFYSVFVNSISPVIAHYGGKILKTGGDSVIYYFPDTAEIGRMEAFQNVLECGVALLELRTAINRLYESEGIPPIGYRISADYGRLEMAESRFSRDQDFFGPTMNLCAKINTKAPHNSIVIGGDLHQVIRKLHSLEKSFQLEEISELSIGLKQRYPVYLVIPIDIDRRMKHAELKKMILRQHNVRTRGDGAANDIGRIGLSNKIPTISSPETDNVVSGNIMLVDDQPDMIFTYRSFLEGQGFKVHAFTDPNLALRHFAKEDSPKYDLVVMDIRMPHLNGLQLYQRLRAINSAVRILFVTALDAAGELISLLPDVAADQVIMKPVTRSRFLSYVDLAVRAK